MRSGFAALIGRPNVGKSTLLNRLLGEKVAIVSPRPQTTRTRIVGILTDERGQVALVDTPGVHEAKGTLHRHMVDLALTAASECDVIVFVVEAEGLSEHRRPAIGPGNRFVLERIRRTGKPTLLVVNKIDLVKKPLLLPLIDLYRQELPEAEVVPVSARHGEGMDTLVSLVLQALPEGEPMFPADVFTDQAERTLVAEYVREQLLRHCREEVPYSAAVVVEHFDESERTPRGKATPQKRSTSSSRRRKSPGKEVPPKGPLLAGLVRIHANVFVERESQKAIVIGKRGQMLKLIGSDARQAIERLLGTHVFLSLQVKVEPRWSERSAGIRRMGYGS